MVRLGIAISVCALLAAGSAAAGDNIQARVYADTLSRGSGCGNDVAFTGSISAPLPGTIEYRFVRSDGVISPSQKVLFEKTGIASGRHELGSATRRAQAQRAGGGSRSKFSNLSISNRRRRLSRSAADTATARMLLTVEMDLAASAPSFRPSPAATIFR